MLFCITSEPENFKINPKAGCRKAAPMSTAMLLNPEALPMRLAALFSLAIAKVMVCPVPAKPIAHSPTMIKETGNLSALYKRSDPNNPTNEVNRKAK